MKIFRKKGYWSGVNEEDLHLIEEREWTGGGNHMLTMMTIFTFCKRKTPLSKGDLYDDYDKKKHRKRLCAECVNALKQAIALRKPKA